MSNVLASMPDAPFSAATSKAGRLQRVAYATLLDKLDQDVLPTNGRFIFYEIEHTGLVRKSKPGEGRRLHGFPSGSPPRQASTHCGWATASASTRSTPACAANSRSYSTRSLNGRQ